LNVLLLNQSLDLGTLVSAAGDAARDLSSPMLFGLGAGLSFEYIARPHDSPSHFVIGFNRNIERKLASRVHRYQTGDRRQVVIEALGENARWFNLDRSPNAALMGMEMLAEHLTDFESVPDWRACLAGMSREIASTKSLYRRLYLRFLEEIAEQLDTALVRQTMSEIALEWDALGHHLAGAMTDASELERCASALRRLAFREEHFWGMILEDTQRNNPLRH
jgi:hypothetical protein